MLICNSAANYFVYEQPLSERVRLFMRLESMFLQMQTFRNANDHFAIQIFLSALFDVLDFLHRYEIRAEILKELQRLEIGDTQEKECEHEALPYSNEETQTAIRSSIISLHNINFNPISELRENELLNSLRQRNVSQSGNYLFEVPAYQFWLTKMSQCPDPLLEHCCTVFTPIADAISLILRIMRDSAVITDEHTDDGVFLKTLQREKRNHMIRIHLQSKDPIFPRVSGDNHRIAIRFMEQDDPKIRAQQTHHPVYFRLQICML